MQRLQISHLVRSLSSNNIFDESFDTKKLLTNLFVVDGWLG